jgi:type II secretory pathway component GspD/PulD (secretin)
VVTQHKSLNAINVRRERPMMGLIKNIIDTADKPSAEILVDVTILEVSRTRLKDLGIDLSSYAIGLAFSPETAPTTVDGSADSSRRRRRSMRARCRALRAAACT